MLSSRSCSEASADKFPGIDKALRWVPGALLLYGFGLTLQLPCAKISLRADVVEWQTQGTFALSAGAQARETRLWMPANSAKAPRG